MRREQRLQRLERLERLASVTVEEYKAYVRGLSDEELDRRVEALRSQVGEAVYQEVLDELKNPTRHQWCGT